MLYWTCMDVNEALQNYLNHSFSYQKVFRKNSYFSKQLDHTMNIGISETDLTRNLLVKRQNLPPNYFQFQRYFILLAHTDVIPSLVGIFTAFYQSNHNIIHTSRKKVNNKFARFSLNCCLYPRIFTMNNIKNICKMVKILKTHILPKPHFQGY